MLREFDATALEFEILKLRRMLKIHENNLYEKANESQFFKNLLIDAKGEVDRMRNQRESDLSLITELNEKHLNEKKKLQHKLDKALNRLVNSSNVSIHQNVSNLVASSINFNQAPSVSEADHNILQAKMEVTLKELDFQKRSNNNLRERIGALLAKARRGYAWSIERTHQTNQQEIMYLLKEYMQMRLRN